MNAQMNPNGSVGWFQERTNTETESEAVAWGLWVSSITNCGQRAAVRIWAEGDCPNPYRSPLPAICDGRDP